MTDAIALESCQPHLHELSNAFSKRALTPNRDYAGRHVDTALFVNQEKLACLQNACADRCMRKRLHQWLASERSAISVFNLQLQSLDQSLKSLTVEGRGSRFTSGRKRDVERIRASMITVRDDALKDYKRKNPERVLRKISERLPVEVLELIFMHFIGRYDSAQISPDLRSQDTQYFNQVNLANFSRVSHRWWTASWLYRRESAIVRNFTSARSFLLKELLFPSASSLKYLRKLDLLNAQISEPKDTVFLRILSDHLVAVEDLKLRVIALRWSTLQHILILVSGSSNAQHGKTFSLKKLALKGSMEAYNKPTSMIKAKEVLRNLECFDLDFTEASGTGEIRNKTISGAVWIFRNIGNVEMNSIRVEANVRLGEDAIEGFLDRSHEFGVLNKRMMRMCLERSSLSRRIIRIITSAFPNLEILSLPNSNLDNHGFQVIAASHLPLKVLNISKSDVDGVAFSTDWHLSHLEELYIDDLTVSDADVNILLRNCGRTLQIFSFRNNISPLAVAKAILDNCRSGLLRKFDIFSIDIWGRDLRHRRFSCAVLHSIIQEMSYLKLAFLDFSSLESDDDAPLYLDAIRQKFPSLEEQSRDFRWHLQSMISVEGYLSLWKLEHAWS